jgi:HPr kinase/phosphorylase
LQNQNKFVTTIHGTLLEIKSLGILIIGNSGVGKSDNALDLITNGAKLIADDVVEIKVGQTGEIIGSAPEKTRHLMEIRGLGIINVKDLFGNQHILDNINIDMIIELTQWDPNIEYDRLGIEENKYNILGVELPYLLLSVTPGRNTATIIELAARNQIFKLTNPKNREKISEQLKNADSSRGVK